MAAEIQPESGVTYVTQFIGTRWGFDRSSEELAPPADEFETAWVHPVAGTLAEK